MCIGISQSPSVRCTHVFVQSHQNIVKKNKNKMELEKSLLCCYIGQISICTNVIERTMHAFTVCEHLHYSRRLNNNLSYCQNKTSNMLNCNRHAEDGEAERRLSKHSWNFIITHVLKPLNEAKWAYTKVIWMACKIAYLSAWCLNLLFKLGSQSGWFS